MSSRTFIQLALELDYSTIDEKGFEEKLVVDEPR